MTKFKEKLHHGWTIFVAEYIKFPVYIMLHPLKGFESFKRDKRASMKVSIVFIVALVVLNILAFQYTGFEMNNNDIRDLNSIAEIIYIVAPIILITVSNWAVTTLADGKGKMKEIFMMISYSLFPLIWSTGIALVLSNFLTGDEIAFYTLTLSLGLFLMGYMIFFGMISIHEYGLVKCIITILGTLLAASIIIFVVLLGYDLFQRIYGFFYTVYREITLRDLI
ncbi:MAG: YIP1 family protein [Bacilli bacterium]